MRLTGWYVADFESGAAADLRAQGGAPDLDLETCTEHPKIFRLKVAVILR